MIKRIFFLGLTLIVIKSFGQNKNYIDQPYVETKAVADTLVKPDLIYLDILLKEKDSRDKVSVEELENNMATILESVGVNLDEQLTLSDLASNFRKYFFKRKDILKSKAYTLKVYDAQTAGKVLVGLERVGISNVTLNKTEYSKMEELKLLLREKAMIKAKKQAERMLKPLNQKIAGALFISDSFHSGRVYGELEEVVIVGYSRNKKQEYEPIAIEFKPINVSCQIIAKFKIE